jgi:hypothetical protein
MKTVQGYLKQAVGALGLAVVFVGTLYLCARLRAYGGPFMVLVVAIGFGASWASTPESREMVAKVARAMRRAGINMKEAAFRSRMDYAQLCRQLGNQEPMHFDRYTCGPTFEMALADEFARPHGALVVENEHLVQIVQRLCSAQRIDAA